MASFKVLAWNGIPAQVKAKEPGSRAVSVQLGDWFTEHIDRVAMHTGRFGTDEYLDGFVWSDGEDREGDAETVANAVAQELEERWAPLRLRWESGDDGVLDELPE